MTEPTPADPPEYAIEALDEGDVAPAAEWIASKMAERHRDAVDLTHRPVAANTPTPDFSPEAIDARWRGVYAVDGIGKVAPGELPPDIAYLLAALGELERLRVAWQRSFAMLRATYPHPDHVPLVVERVIDMMAATLAPSTPPESYPGEAQIRAHMDGTAKVPDLDAIRRQIPCTHDSAITCEFCAAPSTPKEGE